MKILKIKCFKIKGFIQKSYTAKIENNMVYNKQLGR